MAIMNVILLAICNNPPIFDVVSKYNIFPHANVIEHNYDIIRTEYLRYENLYQQTIQCTFNQTPAFKIGAKRDNDQCWRMIMLKKTGKFTSEALNNFSITCKICDHPLVHNAFFSILDPKVNIPSHIGYYKGYLRYHLGVIIPEENGKMPYIDVGGQRYFWQNGAGVLFDDMYYHFVENPTNQRRVVLYIDIIRPLDGVIGSLNRFTIGCIERNPFVKYFISRQHQQKRLT